MALGLSTFAIDTEQMALALRQATARSLVIVDEFGKVGARRQRRYLCYSSTQRPRLRTRHQKTQGTEVSDGVALAGAVLQHFDAQGERGPIVYFTTHFFDLIAHNIVPESEGLKYQVRWHRLWWGGTLQTKPVVIHAAAYAN